jgi:hypothetical protein
MQQENAARRGVFTYYYWEGRLIAAQALLDSTHALAKPVSGSHLVLYGLPMNRADTASQQPAWYTFDLAAQLPLASSQCQLGTELLFPIHSRYLSRCYQQPVRNLQVQSWHVHLVRRAHLLPALAAHSAIALYPWTVPLQHHRQQQRQAR